MKNTLFCLVILFLLCSEAIIVSKSFKVRNYVREFDRFGFAAGGTVDLRVTSDPNFETAPTRLFICTNDDFTRVVNEVDTSSNTEFCTEPFASTIGKIYYNLTDSEQITYQIPTEDLYHFLIIGCSDTESTATLSYTFLNPGGQQLAVGLEPLPILYMLLTALWAILFAVYSFLWLYYKSNRIHLHSFLVVVAFLKLLVVVVALSYWRVCEESGNCLAQLEYFQSLLFAISETAFFCSLLLIAKGWRITRSSLPSSEIRTISVALILLLSTLLFFSFYNDGYYFLSLMIMYFFMLPKIFTSITRNTRALETQLLLINSSGMQLETESITQKIKLFKTLRTSVVIYLGSILLVNSLRIIMIWYLDWFNYVLSEMVVLLMMGLICFVLSPTNRALFSNATLLDSSTFPLFNDDVFVDPELVLFSIQDLNAPDISEMIVVEYPNTKTLDEKLNTPNSVPLVLGIMDKPQQEKQQQPSLTIDEKSRP